MLTPAQEAVVVQLRLTLLLSLGDLLLTLHEFIHSAVSLSGLDRCLRRHGVANLRDLIPKVEGETAPRKSFKDDEPSFFYMDIKYLPQMANETTRRYLFVAFDPVTRWVYLRIYNNQCQVSSTDFQRRLRAASAIKIVKLLTDNGSQFTDRFTSKKKEPSGEHAFDRECVVLGIEHRLIPPRHLQTNGMVERFNGRISDILATTRFDSREQLATTLDRYAVLYNQHIPQKALAHRTPLEAARQWQKDTPELFIKSVRKLLGTQHLYSSSIWSNP